MRIATTGFAAVGRSRPISRLAVIPLLLILLAACGGDGPALPTPSYRMGETVPVDQIELIVTGTDFPAQVDDAELRPGRKFMIVQVTIINRGEQATRVSAAAQMTIADSEGNEYGVEWESVSESDQRRIAPNVPLRNTLRYQVRADQDRFALVYNPSFINSLMERGDRIAIALD